MKKLALLALALLIALPAVSFAGTATSAWDMTIGGFTRLDVSYNSQGIGADWTAVARKDREGNATVTDKYGALTWASNWTMLNFAIKGPDTLGAKSFAYLEGDFRGNQNAGTQGGFQMRQAFFTLKWATTELLMGHAVQPWGLAPGGWQTGFMGYNEQLALKANRQPQIKVTQQFGIFSAAFGVAQPGTPTPPSNMGPTVSDEGRSIIPDLSLDLVLKSPVCGKIGPWMMQFGLGGFYGQSKLTSGTVFNGTTGSAISSKNIDKWMVEAYAFIPIIPERQGNKTNALSVLVQGYTGQNAANYVAYTGFMGPNAGASATYDRNNNDNTGIGNNTGAYNFSPHAPVFRGGLTQVRYYFMDGLWVNGSWAYFSNSASSEYFRTNPNGIRNLQIFATNINWQASPAVLFQFGYTRATEAYGRPISLATGGPSNSTGKGDMDEIRFAAQYFF
jgi:hypothetical protein